MSDRIVFLGEDLDRLLDLSGALSSMSANVDLIAKPRAVRSTLKTGLPEAKAAVICLSGQENVADVRGLLQSRPGTTFLVLSPKSPPPASLAHAVHDCGGEIAWRGEPGVLIGATLIALLAQGAVAGDD